MVTVTPEKSMLCEPSDVKGYLAKNDSATDGTLEMVIEGVSVRMERRVRSVLRHSLVEGEQHTGNGQQPELVLDNGPITSIVSVTMDGALVDPAEYTYQGRVLYRRSGNYAVSWPAGSQVVVNYWAGYPETPADLRLMCAQQSAVEYRKSALAGNRLGLDSSSPVEGDSQSFTADGWLEGVAQGLEYYRKLM